MRIDVHSFRSPVAVLLLLAIAALSSACPGSLEDPDRFRGGGDPCGDVPAEILAPRCATSGCHDATTQAASLDLTNDAGLSARLVGIPASGCGEPLLVDSAAPEKSALYTKCLSTNACASQMPLVGEKLTTDEEACLLGWIESL